MNAQTEEFKAMSEHAVKALSYPSLFEETLNQMLVDSHPQAEPSHMDGVACTVPGVGAFRFAIELSGAKELYNLRLVLDDVDGNTEKLTVDILDYSHVNGLVVLDVSSSPLGDVDKLVERAPHLLRLESQMLEYYERIFKNSMAFMCRTAKARQEATVESTR